MNETNGKIFNKSAVFIISATGVFTALAFILYFIEFPLLPSATFLKVDFSSVPSIVAALFIDVRVGILIELLKNLIHFAVMGSTGGIGELASFTVGFFYLVPLWLTYRAAKEKLALSFLAGSVATTAAACVANYYFLLPAFLKIERPAELVLTAILPFNIIKSVIISGAVFLIYKPLKKSVFNKR